MTKKDEQIKYIYNDFESLYVTEGSKSFKEEDLLMLFKEYQIPRTAYHISEYKKYGIISENNKIYRINAVEEEVFSKAIKEARIRLNVIQKKTKKIKKDNIKILTEKEKEEKYIQFLKEKGYKIQKLIKVQITTYKEEWQEV